MRAGKGERSCRGRQDGKQEPFSHPFSPAIRGSRRLFPDCSAEMAALSSLRLDTQGARVNVSANTNTGRSLEDYKRRAILPADSDQAVLAGRLDLGEGPTPVLIRAGMVEDVSASAPTIADLLDLDDPASVTGRARSSKANSAILRCSPSRTLESANSFRSGCRCWKRHRSGQRS